MSTEKVYGGSNLNNVARIIIFLENDFRTPSPPPATPVACPIRGAMPRSVAAALDPITCPNLNLNVKIVTRKGVRNALSTKLK